MEHFGFIHEELDIKILILFVLKRLPGEIDPETLADLCMCDDGIGYFDYSDCLSDLVDNGNVEKNDFGYKITEKGARNADAVESSLPYSVRSKALRLIEPVEERLRRAAMITAKHSMKDGVCTVELGMSDDMGAVMNLSLICGDETAAKQIEKNFRLDAEGYYETILELLSAKGKKARK